MKIGYINLANSVVVHVHDSDKSTTYTINNSESRYEKIIKALKDKDYQVLLGYLDVNANLLKLDEEGKFVLVEGGVYYEGERISPYLESKIIEFMNDGLPYEYLAAFWNRLRCNPNKNSVDQLYKFLEATKCPITEKGTFIAYKAVYETPDGKYVAIYDKKTPYAIGVPTVLSRDKTNHDASVHCGPGLHSGSFSYATTFGSDNDNYKKVILEVEVDPADVVSVPSDSGCHKCRSCCVIPRAVFRSEKEHPSSIIIDGSNIISDVATSMINNIKYSVIDIDRTAFEVMSNQKIFPANQAISIFADTAPDTISAIGTVSKCLHMLFNNSYYVEYTTESGDFFYKAFVVDDVNVNDQPSVDINHEENVKSDVVPGFVFSRSKYVRVNSSHDELNAALLLGAKKVKPSKVPPMINNDVDNRLRECYRYEDIDASTVFYAVLDNVVYKYMKE